MEVSKDEKEKLRNFLEEYLKLKGINTKKLFRCLSKEHEDKNPSMSYFPPAKICKCFGCGKTYNIFQLVGEEYNITNYNEQIIKVRELFNNRNLIKDANESFYSKKNMLITLDNEGNKKMGNERKKEYSSEKIKNYANYIKECEKNLKYTNYLEKRGIPISVQKKYHIGFDPKFKNGEWQAIIIPTDYCSFTARNTNTSEDRLRKVGKAAIFNYWELNIEENKDKPFFIVEGEIDALSIITAGQKAIALGSISNSNLLLDNLKTDCPSNKFFLMLDNDSSGKKATENLYTKLKEININVEKLSSSLERIYNKFKDPNEFLIKDPENFKKFITEIYNGEEKVKKSPIRKKIKSREDKLNYF
ncbi:toprim domain-containing protein [Fusobacterium gastrosuis]|uniref:toprim domain-containing protein n=1 Tax=Fusobacterium gastrosuis TaxID=1755100 RepID=UPI002A9B8681|nr:toprim domain-containing protein [Fusobacterium gastrosuis]